MRSRIRTIKPEAHTDEELWDLEVETGLPIFRGFVGLWNFADREGRFEWRPRPLKAGILPYWSGDFADVLDALRAAGFIVRYEVGGRVYGLVRTFSEHQFINNREEESTLPPPPDDASGDACATCKEREGDACGTREPPGTVESPGESSAADSSENPDTSTRAPRVNDASGTRGSRVSHATQGERNGTERNGTDPDQDTLSAAEPPQRGKPRSDVAEVFDHWRTALGKSQAAKLDVKRKRRIEWALRAYGLDAVKRCIDGYAASRWHRGENDRGRPYDDLTLWLRDAEHIERGIAMADQAGPAALPTRGALPPARIDPEAARESQRKALELFGDPEEAARVG